MWSLVGLANFHFVGPGLVLQFVYYNIYYTYMYLIVLFVFLPNVILIYKPNARNIVDENHGIFFEYFQKQATCQPAAGWLLADERVVDHIYIYGEEHEYPMRIF